MNSMVRGGAFAKQGKLKSFDELIREHSSGLSYRALEQRMAFDGAAVATAAAADQSAHQDSGPSDGDSSAAPHAAATESIAFASSMPDGSAAAESAPSVQIVFIDSAVNNASAHLAGVDPSAEVVVLDSNRDGLEQISSYLAGRTDIGSIHIISHGDQGSLILGNSIVTGGNLQAYASELQSIGQALSADGDILIYGCAFGSGEQGRAAADLFAALTGADVAASTDATGSLAHGGDFDLEYQTGAIESRVAISAEGQAAYDDVLAVTVNNGNGSLVIGVANTLYTVDTTTGKATAITTIPGTIGGVAFTGPANSIAIDQTNGLIYYTDNTGANTNRALFAYDFVNNTHILIDSDLTNNGAGASLTVGTTGLGSGSATFHNGVLYLGVENVTGTDDQIYAITFTGAGRTVSAITNFGAAITGTNDWGDLSIDVAGNALVSVSQATGITRYSLSTGLQISNVAYASTGPQAAHDVNGNTYIINTSIQRVNATTGANIGAAIAITTDGTTAITAPPDAASWIPQTGSIGDKIFDDNNTDGVFNAGDTGIANVTVQLIDDVNNNGVVDVGERVLATDTTDASGNYLFSGVTPGRYIVRVTDTNGILGTAASTTGGSTQTETITLIGGSSLARDFGYNAFAPIVDLNSTPTPSPSSGNTTSNLITSGNFGTAASGTPPAPWTEGSQANAGAVVLNGTDGRWDWTQNPGANSTLTQAVTVPADSTTTTNTATSTTTVTTHDEVTSLSFGLAWQNEDILLANDNTLTISYAGVTYATFTTFAGGTANAAGIVGTWVYSNGASGPAQTLSVTNEVTGALTTVTITLPAGITASGNLVFTYGNGPSGAGADDIAIDNVVLTATRTTTTTVTTADTANNDWTATYTENGPAVSIADTDSSIFDGDGTIIRGASITLTNPATGDRLLVNGSSAASGTLPSGIAWTRTDSLVTLSGNFTQAQYADAIELIQFENTTDTPSATPRVIHVTVSDGISTSNTAVATINVDRAPDSVNDTASGNEDTAISGNVLTNDDLGDTPITSVTVLTGPANGTLTSFNTMTGAFVYTPNANFNGTDTFTYRVTDADGDISTATVTITVNAVNDPPTQVVPGAQTTAEDTNRVITGTSVADVDGGALTTTLTLPVGAGTITVVTGGGATITNNGTGTVTIAGTAAQINAAIASITYAPTADYNGSTSLSVSTTDGAATASNSIAITVTAVADITNDAVTTNEDTAATFNVITGTNGATADSFENAGAVVTSVTQGANGTVTFLANGSVTYTPNANFNGSDSFTYTVTSGGVTETATVTVTVTAVNDAPVVAGDSITTAEDTPFSGSLPVATDVDGDTLTYSLATAPTNGVAVVNSNGTYTYTPNANYNGPDSFTFTVSDGNGGFVTRTVSITVTPVNDAPTAGALVNQSSQDSETDSYNASTVFSDVDGDTLSYSATGLPAGLSINPATGVISGTLTSSASQGGVGGVYTVTVTANDGAGGSVSRGFTWTVTNPAPNAVADTFTTEEDTPLNGNVLGNDSDPDGDTLTVNTTPVSGPANGTLVLNSDGTFTYTPDLDYTGTDSFAYQLIDADGGVSTATVSLTIYPENDDPFHGVPAAQNVNEDQNLVFSSANGNAITVLDGDSATVDTTLSVANGTLTLGSTAGVTVVGNGTGTVVVTGSPAAITTALNGLTYRNTSDYNGADSLSVSTTDGVGAANSSVAITVAPVADIVADARTTNEDVAITFNALTNDTFENAGRAVTSVTQGANGTVTFTAAGLVTYTPNANFNGSDSFTYTVTSGGVTETATVTVTVTAVNDPPTQVVPGAQTTAEDTARVFRVSNGNAIVIADIDGDTLTTTISVTNGALTLGSTAGVTVTGNGTNTVTISGAAAAITNALEGLSFAPAADYNGAALLTISTTDGAATANGSVGLTITPVADIVANSASTNEDTAATFNVLTNDTFEDAGRAVTSVTQGANGTVMFLANGSVTYTPDVNFNGSDSFTYTVTSGGVTETTTVTVTVNAINDAPTLAAPGAQSTGEDSPLVFSTGNGNAIVVADVDGGSLTLTLSAANGRLTLGSTAGVTVTGNGTGTVTVAGTAAAINAAVNGLSFAPTADYNGSAGVTASVSDGALSASQSVGITVTPVADITTDAVTTNEDTAITFNAITGTNGATADTFENAGRAVTSVTQGASGTVSFLANGAITYTPNVNFNGSDSFTYTVTSGGVTETTTVSVTIGSVNDVPTTTGLTNRSNADGQSVTLNVSTAFTDADGDTLTYAITGLPPGLTFNPATGVITGTIDNSASVGGPYTVSVTASDGNPGGNVTTTFTWTVSNPAPIAANDSATLAEDTSATIAVLANDNDPDGDSLTVTTATASNGVVTINGDGTITYTPAANFNGVDTIAYQISDGEGGFATATVSVTVTPVNDAPVATGTSITTPEDTPRSGTLPVATDVDGDTLTYSLATGAANGVAVVNSNGTYSYTPNANYNGPDSFTFTVSDGNGGSVTRTVAVTVTPVNDPPVVAGVSITTPEDTPFAGSLPVATDVDGDSLTYSLATGAANGAVVVNSDGTFTYTPNANFNGSDSFTFRVSDGNGGIVTRTVTIAVTPVNDAPVAVADAFTGAEDATISGDVTPGTSGQDSDVDGDTLTVVDFDGNGANGITPVSGPSNGVLTLNANGTFSYTPNANFNGTDSFTYRISDGNGGFAQAVVTLNITPVNDAPVVAGTSITTPEDTPFSGSLPVATDADGDTLTYSRASNPLHGTVVVNSNGTYTYTPTANYSGSDSFSFTVSDGNGGTVTRTVTIVVTPVQDAPVIAPIPNPVSNDSATISLNLGAYVSDVDGDTLTYSATGLPPGLSINPATGQVTGTLPPNASSGGPYAVTLTVDDGAGGVVTRTFSWTVQNPPPVARNDFATAQLDETITVAALANDSDPDGDAPISVTSASAANGAVIVLPDGSIQYTPASGFIGRDTVSYTISDGNGGFATATITITVGDDGYTDKDTVFGFNGPETDDDDASTGLQSYESISADGAVIDAVFDIHSLNSLAGQLSGDGIVVAAANGVSSLGGIGAVNGNGVVVDAVRAERAREIAFRAGFDRDFKEYRIDGLPGFSLRHSIPGNLGELNAREQIVIESLVRDRTLIMQISNTLERGARKIIEYRITQLDGSPLPGWLNRAASDLLIGRRDVDVDKVGIRIEAVYVDGSTVIEEVVVDTATGEIQPVKAVRQGDSGPALLFRDQFRAKPSLSGEQVQSLGRALAR
ncbi:MAG: tandem-95 repeat protein [Hyphomicrobium sp.]